MITSQTVAFSAENDIEIEDATEIEAGEACAANGMVRLDGAKKQQDKLRRVGSMLQAMIS